MLKNYYLRCCCLIAWMMVSTYSFAQYPAGSPVAVNGQLHVDGVNLKNECNQNVQLRGMSSHGLQWHENCINNQSSLDLLAGPWKSDILRLAMYVGEEGYNTNPAKWMAFIDNMVDECQKRGIYCMIDWHVTNTFGGDPNTTLDLAKPFFEHMSKQHNGKKHVLYEIANEPVTPNDKNYDAQWIKIKQYANIIIPIIRANDPKNIIIVGTPFFSSQVDAAAKSPLTGTNLMYALHFYSGNSEHDPYRDLANTAIKAGLPIFVTEFGVTEPSGGGAIDLNKASGWISWMKTNNISWCNWNFSDNATTSAQGVKQTSAVFNGGVCSTNAWDNLSPAGTYIKGQVSGPDGYSPCATVSNVVPPAVTITTPASDTSYLTGTNIVLTAKVTGTASGVEFYDGNTKLGTAASAPYTYTWTGAAKGLHTIKAHAVSGSTYGISSAVVVYVNDAQKPYKGTATPIPGKIEAENYDEGGNLNAYYDKSVGQSGTSAAANAYRKDDVDLEGTGPNYTVGYGMAGEWLEYTVKVKETALHSISLFVASLPGGKIHVEFDGKDVTKSITVPAGKSWTEWKSVKVNDVPLTDGTHIMRVFFETSDVNLDYIEVLQTGPGTVTNVLSYDNLTNTTLYPNPSNSAFTLEVNNDISSMTVTDMMGKLVEGRADIKAGTTLNLGAALEAGTYLLKVQYSSGQTEMMKMTKVK